MEMESASVFSSYHFMADSPEGRKKELRIRLIAATAAAAAVLLPLPLLLLKCLLNLIKVGYRNGRTVQM